MLRELHISNLAVIADARIELGEGLNCFTGATGAGKSLVIGALEVLLGLRSPAEMLRPGVDEGRVSGVFDVPNPETLRKLEAIADVPVSADGGELLLTRRLYASGRSSVSLNGNPITLAMLKLLAEQLVDVHGQHDHQFLLKPANQVDVIDQFGNLSPLRERYHETYLKLQEAKRRVDELSANRALREQQLELYRFQVDEIDTAALDPAEYTELKARSAVLQNLEKIKTEAGAVHGALYESEGSVVERLKEMAAELSQLAALDAHLKSVADTVRDGLIQLEEAAFDLSRYLDKLDLDPGELEEVSDRLDTINRVLHKYGDPIEATLAHREATFAKVEQLERATDDLTTLQAEIKPLSVELKRLGEELTAKRKAVAEKLGPLVERELAALGMEKATFRIALSPASSTAALDGLPATPSGFDTVEFVAQTNPGQLPQPLRKIASGGELGRIMLALKGILAQSDRISVLVFDEIDANVGGRLGSIIGKKLRSLAEHHQVLCITHLPQIACYADRHLTVRKQVIDNQTRTVVRTMEGAERLEEIAEMIGGPRITEVTRAQAQELLDLARDEMKTMDRGRRNGKATQSPQPGDSSPEAPKAEPPEAGRRAKVAKGSRK